MLAGMPGPTSGAYFPEEFDEYCRETGTRFGDEPNREAKNVENLWKAAIQKRNLRPFICECLRTLTFSEKKALVSAYIKSESAPETARRFRCTPEKANEIIDSALRKAQSLRKL